eukprot:g12015.t1
MDSHAYDHVGDQLRSTPKPKDPPKFTTEMQILSSCYDLSVEAQRKKARAQYEEKGFAYFVPVGLNNNNNNARGLTVLPENGDGRGHDDEWLSETSPAAQVWNSHWFNSDRLRSGNTVTGNDPSSYGWAGAATGSCSPDLSKRDPFKFYSECPAGLWDGVPDEAKKREHLQQLASKQGQGLYDRALFVVNVQMRDAENVAGVAPALEVLHADSTLENTVAGSLKLRHQTLQPADFPTPNLNYGTGMSLLGYFNSVKSSGLFEGAWPALFAEDSKVRNKVGVEICGLEPDDFKYVTDHFQRSDLDATWNHALGPFTRGTREGGMMFANFVQYAIFLRKLHELEVKDALAEKGVQPQAARDEMIKLLEMKEAVRRIVLEKLVPTTNRVKDPQKSEEKWRQWSTELLQLGLGNMLGLIFQNIRSFMSAEKMEKWGCFFGRLRVHDAYNVWINLTPADEGEDRATPNLPGQLKNPMAVLDPFTMLPNQSKAHSIAFPYEKHWTERGEEATRKTNKWYVRPEMYFGEALWFNTNVSYHTAVKDMDYMGNKRKSIESRVIVVDTCVAPLGGQGGSKRRRLRGKQAPTKTDEKQEKFSLAELKKQCWGKDM